MPKTQKELNMDLLIAIYQNLQTAMQSINNVLDKVKDSKLKRELKSQFKEYDSFFERCEDYAKVEGIKLQENGFFKKAKMWLSVNMATMLNKSNRKIASINIVGSTMGIIDLISVISDCKNGKKELVDFGKEVLKYEEENVERLKPYILFENNKPQSEVFKKGNSNSKVAKSQSPQDKAQKMSGKNKTNQKGTQKVSQKKKGVSSRLNITKNEEKGDKGQTTEESGK